MPRFHYFFNRFHFRGSAPPNLQLCRTFVFFWFFLSCERTHDITRKTKRKEKNMTHTGLCFWSLKVEKAWDIPYDQKCHFFYVCTNEVKVKKMTSSFNRGFGMSRAQIPRLLTPIFAFFFVGMSRGQKKSLFFKCFVIMNHVFFTNVWFAGCFWASFRTRIHKPKMRKIPEHMSISWFWPWFVFAKQKIANFWPRKKRSHELI